MRIRRAIGLVLTCAALAAGCRARATLEPIAHDDRAPFPGEASRRAPGTTRDGRPSTVVVEDELVVVGDEVPGIVVAVYAARQGIKVTLVAPTRAERGKIGGLLVRGNLAYLDRNQVFDQRTGTFLASSFAYAELLRRLDVKAVAFDPRRADRVFRQMLAEAGIRLVFADPRDVESRGVVTVDATRSAQYARRLGAKFHAGFATMPRAAGGTHPDVTLAVTPVFTVKGVGAEGWIQLEKDLGATPDWVGPDFIDVMEDVVGRAYHAWRGTPFDKTLKSGAFFFDRANISLIGDGDLCVNALLVRTTVRGAVAIADDPTTPEAVKRELGHIQAFLRAHGLPEAEVVPPEELYVRHSGNVETHDPVSLESLLKGGTGPYWFAYHFDVRGVQSEGGAPVDFPVFIDPRTNARARGLTPLFRFGTSGTRVAGFDDLYVVGAAAGYTDLAPAVGRIEELNIGKAELLSREVAKRIRRSRPAAVRSPFAWLHRVWARGDRP